MTATHETAPTLFVDVMGDRFAYRRFGMPGNAPPLLFLQHYRGGLDHWDPLLTDGLAAGREVILLNYRGVASSSGAPRTRVEDMADDAAAVVRALGLAEIDLLGFSIGGFVAQDLVRRHAGLVRRLILLGTGPRGGVPDMHPLAAEIAPRPEPTVDDFLFLFFGRSEAAIRAGRAFWARRHARPAQDPPSSPAVLQAQLEAILYFMPKLDRKDPFAHLRAIDRPTLVVNGSDDVMVPTINSWHLAQNIPNAELVVYPDAGHAAQFQYPERFLPHAVRFLEG